MMKKLLYVVLMGLILTSCSKEEVSIDDPKDFGLTLLDNNDFSSKGTYKGVYASLADGRRGDVVISVTETEATATITFNDLSVLRLMGTGSATSESKAATYGFTGIDTSFNFSVAADGSTPIISDVIIEGIAGSVVVAKELSSTPIRTQTGTYGCSDCPEHPILGDPEMADTFVWNIVFSDDGYSASNLLTQIIYNGRMILASGSMQNPFLKNDEIVYNELFGDFTFGLEGHLNWDATQLYNIVERCNNLAGNWKLTTATTDIEGWLLGDDTCNPE